MAILFSDGFDYYNTTSGSNNELINISTRYPSVVSTWANFFSYTAGYSGGQSLLFSTSSSTSNSIPVPIPNTLTSVTMGAHVYFPSLSAEFDFFKIAAPNGTYILLSVSSSGVINTRITGSGTSTARSSTFSIAAATWYYLELHAEVTGADQILVSVYLNNTQVFLYTGTGFTATPYYWSSFTIGKSQLGNSGAYRMDNFYLSDGEILGAINISTIVPSGDTAQKDGIPVNGTTNYNMVNDINAPTMDTNILLKTDLATDYYTTNGISLVNTDDTVISVQGLSYSMSGDASSSVRTSVQLSSSSTETTDSIPLLPGVTSPQIVTSSHIRVDPATNSTWTLSGVNSAQLGVRRHDNFTVPNNGFYIGNTGNYPSNVSGSTIIAGDNPPTVSGNALLFDGTQNIRYTDVPFWHVTMPYSVQFEFYTTNLGVNQMICTVGGNVQTPGWPEWAVFLTAGSGVALFSNANNAGTAQVTQTLLPIANMSTNTWYKIGFMFYSGRMRGYLNDSQAFDVALTNGTIVDSSYGFAIGGDNAKDSGRQFFGGVRKFIMANQLFWAM